MFAFSFKCVCYFLFLLGSFPNNERKFCTLKQSTSLNNNTLASLPCDFAAIKMAAKMKQKSAIAAWLAVFFPSDKTYSVISTKNAEKKLKLISEIECEVLFGKTWYSGRILGGFTKKCDAQDITQKAEGKEI